MRMRGAGAFQRVFASPHRSSDALLTVLARRNGLEHGRLGLAISRRHLRRAVDRNRVKRIVRESFRLHQAQLHGLDVVVLARSGILASQPTALRRALVRHWSELSRRCVES